MKNATHPFARTGEAVNKNKAPSAGTTPWSKRHSFTCYPAHFVTMEISWERELESSLRMPPRGMTRYWNSVSEATHPDTQTCGFAVVHEHPVADAYESARWASIIPTAFRSINETASLEGTRRRCRVADDRNTSTDQLSKIVERSWLDYGDFVLSGLLKVIWKSKRELWEIEMATAIGFPLQLLDLQPALGCIIAVITISVLVQCTHWLFLIL